jgi:uncharacterized protein HemX
MMPNQRRLACKAECRAADDRPWVATRWSNETIVMQMQTKGSEPMRTNLKTLLSTAAVVAALAVGPAVYAYAETPNQNESGSMMQHGQGDMMGQGGMMNMMQQMSQMMETCNNMMQEMSQRHESGAPKEGAVPDKEG